MANVNFTCVLDAWRDGQTLYGRMHYYRADGQSRLYSDYNFPNPTMNLGGSVYTDTAFGDRVRAGITVGDVYSTTFSRTVAGTGDRTVTWSAGSGQRSDFAGTWSKTVNFPQTVTPPTGLSVTIVEVGARSAKFNVSISSYGNPSSASGRWIEAGIAGQNAWHSPSLRSANVQNVTSAQITVDNNSTKTTTLTIQPNTQYYYGGYAYNTQAETSTIAGQLVTKCEAVTIKFIKSGVHSATFGYVTRQDGGFYNKIIEYSLDNGATWTTIETISGGAIKSGELTIKNLALGNTYTALFRTRTTAGATGTTSITFTTIATRDGYRLMGPVSDQATTANILYGRGNRLGDLELKGDTHQVITTGKNLVDAPNAAWVSNADATLSDTDGVFKMTCNPGVLARCCLPLQNLVNGTTYTVSFYAKGVSIASSQSYTYAQARTANNGGTWLGESTAIGLSNDFVRYRTTFTATSVANPYVWFYLSSSTNNTNSVEIYVKDIQLEVGSAMTDYEPYTGGAPAPSPTYPQPIDTVTGEQVVTVEGKNLMPVAEKDFNSTSRIESFRMHLAPGTYTASFDLDSFTMGSDASFMVKMQLRDALKGEVADPALCTIDSSTTLGRKSVTFTTTNTVSSTQLSNIRIPETQWNNGARAKISNIQIEAGSTATDYESFQGGNYVINLGKNLLGFPSGSYSNQGITWIRDPETNTAVGSGTLSTTYSTAVIGESYDGGLPPGTYTFSIAEALPSPYKLELACHWTDGTHTNYSPAVGSKKRTITTTKWMDRANVAIVNGVASTQVSNLTIKNFQLERNGIDTTFSPYKEPVELCKLSSSSDAPNIFNYQDYFYKSNGAWYLHREIEKMVYDGSDDEDWKAHNQHNNIYAFNWRGAGAAHSNSAILANKYRPVYITTYNSDSLRDYGMIATLESTSTSEYTSVFMTAPNSSVTTLQQFKDWLAANPVTVYCAIPTPKEIRITDSGLVSQLESLYDTNPADSNVIVSVEGQLKLIPSYTLQTGVTKKINKLYGSVNNKARRVF